MDHSRALCDTADAALFAVELEFDCNALELGVGGHDAPSRIVRALVGKAGNELVHARRDGSDVKLLTDNARRSDDDVLRGDARRLVDEVAHRLRDLNAVGVAGVCVAAVADHGACAAVGEVGAGDLDGRAADEVGGVYCRRRALAVADDEGKILLRFVLADAAMNARGAEALRGANAAFNVIYHNLSPFTGLAPIAIFIFWMAAPDAPLPRLQNNA